MTGDVIPGQPQRAPITLGHLRTWAAVLDAACQDLPDSPARHRIAQVADQMRHGPLSGDWTLRALIEASSLGTPDAVTMRERTTPEHARRVMERAKQITEEEET